MKFTLMLLSCVLALPMMRAATLAESAESATPLTVGSEAPQVSVLTTDGGLFDLGAAVREQPTVLIFYRGGWCPYCNRHLMAMQEIESDLMELGYQIIAVSPDKPAALQPTTEKNELHYQLLSDRAMKAASAYGVAFAVSDAVRTKYKEYGIDLAAVPGEPDARWLPVPAVFIINGDGVVRYVHTNPDYKLRLDPDDLLMEAENALESDD